MNSAFSKGAFCPSCKKYVIGQGGVPDPAWKCVYCPEKICAYCYDAHTAEKHPETYTPQLIVTIASSPYGDGDSFFQKHIDAINREMTKVVLGESWTGEVRGNPVEELRKTIEQTLTAVDGVIKFDGDSYTVVDPNRVTPE